MWHDVDRLIEAAGDLLLTTTLRVVVTTLTVLFYVLAETHGWLEHPVVGPVFLAVLTSLCLAVLLAVWKKLREGVRMLFTLQDQFEVVHAKLASHDKDIDQLQTAVMSGYRHDL